MVVAIVLVSTSNSFLLAVLVPAQCTIRSLNVCLVYADATCEAGKRSWRVSSYSHKDAVADLQGFLLLCKDRGSRINLEDVACAALVHTPELVARVLVALCRQRSSLERFSQSAPQQDTATLGFLSVAPGSNVGMSG